MTYLQELPFRLRFVDLLFNRSKLLIIPERLNENKIFNYSRMNLNNFTIKAQETIAKAQQVAFNNGNPNIETEHLLKSLLDDDDTPVIYILKKNNVNVSFIET